MVPRIVKLHIKYRKMMSFEYKVSEKKLGKRYLVEAAIILFVVVIIFAVLNNQSKGFADLNEYVRLFFLIMFLLPSLWYFIFGSYYLIRRREDWYIKIDGSSFTWKQPNGKKYVIPLNEIKSFDVVFQDSLPSFFLLTRINQFLALSINSGVSMDRIETEMEEYGVDTRSFTIPWSDDYHNQLEASGYTRIKSL